MERSSSLILFPPFRAGIRFFEAPRSCYIFTNLPVTGSSISSFSLFVHFSPWRLQNAFSSSLSSIHPASNVSSTPVFVLGH